MPLEEEDASNLILIVTGSTLRAEACDRPLAYRLQRMIRKRMAKEVFLRPVVIGDIWYLNSEELQQLPTISVGGPGVNATSQFFFPKLPTALGIDGLFTIQMDVAQEDHRCCIWGLDHHKTIQAISADWLCSVRITAQLYASKPIPCAV
ncbi:MAG TPA: hypothetical protein VHP11_17325 [Tepidisphaeraceae bacterium]|nr:hypothetical protein [Tepidisphaeraceae bacterium]